jgi:hypothetical protein
VEAVIRQAEPELLGEETAHLKHLRVRLLQEPQTRVAAVVVERETHLPVPALLALSLSLIRHSYP